MKKPTKEQIKDLLLIIAVICLFKIAFFGITTNIKTDRKGLYVNTDISTITIDGSVSVEGTDNTFSKPIPITVEN